MPLALRHRRRRRPPRRAAARELVAQPRALDRLLHVHVGGPGSHRVQAGEQVSRVLQPSRTRGVLEGTLAAGTPKACRPVIRAASCAGYKTPRPGVPTTIPSSAAPLERPPQPQPLAVGTSAPRPTPSLRLPSCPPWLACSSSPWRSASPVSANGAARGQGGAGLLCRTRAPHHRLRGRSLGSLAAAPVGSLRWLMPSRGLRTALGRPVGDACLRTSSHWIRAPLTRRFSARPACPRSPSPPPPPAPHLHTPHLPHPHLHPACPSPPHTLQASTRAS